MNFPRIIQGGMGVAVSGNELARAVSLKGELGVVSGTSLDTVVALRLQKGDLSGAIRRALSTDIIKPIGSKIIEKYYLKDGVGYAKNFQTELPTEKLSREKHELIIAANYAEVFLAKEGHDGVVGINYLEKIQTPNVASIYGAMLAGVDYVIMGAGIPRDIPAIIEKLCNHEKIEYRLNIEGTVSTDVYNIVFDPKEYGFTHMKLKRPKFLAIVSSNILALTLMKKSIVKPDGIIIEFPCAGGHNAPPRGGVKELDADGAPIYGAKDVVDIDQIKALEIPFYLAGSYGKPEKLKEAIAYGAVGVQVGTPFALCNESGLLPEYKEQIREGSIKIFTDSRSSPTGFPFKVAAVFGTVAIDEIYKARKRVCNLGYLREVYKKEDGSVGFRCGAAPIRGYLLAGGKEEDTVGRKCLCNGLFAAIGLPLFTSDGTAEPAIITLGDDLDFMKLMNGKSYSATDVIDYIRGDKTF